jgi:peptidyl-tRNA hydrolase, PTH1 family
MGIVSFFRTLFPGTLSAVVETPQKVIVGLGNPGGQYRQTPHNLGFEVIDWLAAEAAVSCGRQQCRARVGVGRIGGTNVLLVKPQAFMNRSGLPVKELLEQYRRTAGELIVVCDDLALPFGKVRVRAKGSSGGHKGLQSIIERLGTSEFVRVRLGIGPETQVEDAAEYVLSSMPGEKQAAAQEMIRVAGEAVKTICQAGVQAAMNQHN